jgi:hypothetical protein
MIWTFRVLLVGIVFTGASCRSSAHVDHHESKVIVFEEFGSTFHLSDKRTKFRLDGIVTDLDQHQSKLIAEFGLARAKFIYTNAATNGRTPTWRNKQGITWAIAYARDDSDQRIARSRLTHEKYHALCIVSPKDIPVLHSAIEARGYVIHWGSYDEELRATIVEVASLAAQGMPLENLGGSELVVKALQILRAEASTTRVNVPP